MKTKRITIPIYPCWFEIVYFNNDDIEEFSKKYPFAKENFDTIYCSVAWYENHNIFYLFLKEDKNRKITNGIVAHECFHIMNRVFNFCGVTYNTTNNQEHSAYMLGFLVDKVHLFCKNNKITLK